MRHFGCIQRSPAATARSAGINFSPLELFNTYPCAPASKSPLDIYITVKRGQHDTRAFGSRFLHISMVASMPVLTVIRESINTKSGFMLFKQLNACAPSEASATISMSLSVFTKPRCPSAPIVIIRNQYPVTHFIRFIRVPEPREPFSWLFVDTQGARNFNVHTRPTPGALSMVNFLPAVSPARADQPKMSRPAPTPRRNPAVVLDSRMLSGRK